jgi:hypothetical protein
MTTLPALTRSRSIRFALRLLAATWMAAEAGAALPQATPMVAAEAPARASVVAVFTGEFQRGTAVYRLPSVTVTAKRDVGALQAPVAKRTPRVAQPMPARDTRAPS